MIPDWCCTTYRIHWSYLTINNNMWLLPQDVCVQAGWICVDGGRAAVLLSSRGFYWTIAHGQALAGHHRNGPQVQLTAMTDLRGCSISGQAALPTMISPFLKAINILQKLKWQALFSVIHVNMNKGVSNVLCSGWYKPVANNAALNHLS